METVDSVVIGAGAVGLACARALAMAGREVLVLEAEGQFGTGISSRNSEVIHAGLYSPPGSLKARLCLEGRDALYDYCARQGVAHRRCGKLVVAATPAQAARLDAIQANAEACGVAGLQRLDQAALRTAEPALAGASALLSPDTGIIDSHGLMLSLLGDAERHGASLAVRAPVTSMAATGHGIEIQVGGEDAMALLARRVVNAAGLGAGVLAGRTAGLRPGSAPVLRYAKGNYFVLQGRAPFSRLIYPIPEAAGLGIHLTLDLGGQARFGPDVEWVDAPHYLVDAARATRFEQAIRAYWPGLPDGALQPGYAGVRPKLHGPDEPAPDFRIDGEAEHGVPGLVNLFGIESPGLTASLAIGARVAAQLA
ncbi:MAG: NAD(P)/FAD-dependent oxidoreductase [Rhodocyclaceae bacterium]|nr:NAD(P)/FAD-dependent oxidoreductase [Rhodocyclaceae bacterium]